MSEETLIGFRLRQIIEYYGLNITSFSSKIGLQNSTITRIVNDSSRGISVDVLSKISKQFPDVNLNWLLMGNQSMLISESHDNFTIQVNGYGTKTQLIKSLKDIAELIKNTPLEALGDVKFEDPVLFAKVRTKA